MKVGVFHPALNLYGGAEFVALVVTNTLARHGYDVQLFVNEKINQEKAEKKFGEGVFPSVKVITKPSSLQPRGVADIYQSFCQTLALKSKCDILIDTYSNCIFPWTDLCYIHFPLISSYMYKPSFPYIKSSSRLPVAFLPYTFFEKGITKHVTPYHKKLLIANSKFTAKEFNDYSNTDAHVVYPPVPSTFFKNNQNNTNKKQHEDLVVTISRFHMFKGLEKIPYIAKSVHKNVNFVIIGIPEDKTIVQSIQRTIKKLGLTKRVKLLTDVSRQEMKDVLSRAKIYLHTTVGEHFGISIVEAMAMGCIPIVHKSGGVTEYLHTDYTYSSIEEAAQKINNNICNWSPTKGQKFISIADKFKEENFSNEFMKLFRNYEINKYN